MTVICNRMHECPQSGDCKHAEMHEHVPHSCGKGHYICESSKLLSGCVPVEDGTYKCWVHEWCKCGKCGTGHWHEWIEVRDAKTGKFEKRT